MALSNAERQRRFRERQAELKKRYETGAGIASQELRDLAEEIKHRRKEINAPAPTRDFVQVLRDLRVQPHVTQNLNRAGGSAIDRRTTRHASYHISQRKRPLIERAFR